MCHPYILFIGLADDRLMLYNILYRARRGVSGALYPQSAIAESNSCLRHASVKSVMLQGTMKIGSCAIQNCEPRQVRKEAAVSGTSGCAASQPDPSMLRMIRLCLPVEDRCTVLYERNEVLTSFFYIAGNRLVPC